MMSKEIIKFDNIEIEKIKFRHCKNQIVLKDADIEIMQVSSMVSSGQKNYKYLIGQKDDDYKIKSF